MWCPGRRADFFDSHRIAIIGRSEMGMLDKFTLEQKTEDIERYFSLHPVAVILARGIPVAPLNQLNGSL